MIYTGTAPVQCKPALSDWISGGFTALKYKSVILPWQSTGESLDCGLGHDLERLEALGHHHGAIRALQTSPEIQKVLESEKIGVGACRGSEIVNFLPNWPVKDHVADFQLNWSVKDQYPRFLTFGCFSSAVERFVSV